MKTLKFTLVALIVSTFMSCGGSSSEQPVNADDFSAIEKDLKAEFGENAYYTNISIGYDELIGIWINTTVTDKPESLKMGEWTLSQGSWKQSSEVTLEISDGAEASDFMYQLKDDFSLKTLGGLVQESMKKLTAEKAIENPALSTAYIKFPDNGDVAKAEYVVQLEPKNGGTSFNFSYKINGEFIEMSY